jgi:hypothetical protein
MQLGNHVEIQFKKKLWVNQIQNKPSTIWEKMPKQIKSLPFCSFKKQY